MLFICFFSFPKCKQLQCSPSAVDVKNSKRLPDILFQIRLLELFGHHREELVKVDLSVSIDVNFFDHRFQLSRSWLLIRACAPALKAGKIWRMSDWKRWQMMKGFLDSFWISGRSASMDAPLWLTFGEKLLV